MALLPPRISRVGDTDVRTVAVAVAGETFTLGGLDSFLLFGRKKNINKKKKKK